MINPIPQTFLTVLGIYFVGMAYLGYISTKKTDSIKEFLTMGGMASAFVAGMAYLSTQISMSTFMGVPGSIYQTGWAIAGMGLTGGLMLWMPTFLVGMRLTEISPRLQIYTLADYFSSRYYSKFMRLLVGLITVVYILPSVGAQTIGAGVIWKTYTGQPEWVGVLVMAGIVTYYCLAGGIRGAVLTDVAQSIIMAITGFGLMLTVVTKNGGFSALSTKLAAHNVGKMSFPGSPTATANYQWLFSQMFLWSFFTIGMPQLISKFFLIKTREKAVKSSIYGAIAGVFGGTMIYIAAAYAPVLIPALGKGQTDFTIPVLASLTFPGWLASACMAGLLAAGMSTIDSMLVVTSGGLVRDIYHSYINPKAEDKDLLKLIRWVTVICGFIAAYIGIKKPGTIFEIILFTWGGLGVMTIPLLLGVRWKRCTKEGAIVGLILGEVYHAIAVKYPAWAFKFNAGIPALAVTAIITIVVSLMTKPPPLEVLEEHYS